MADGLIDLIYQKLDFNENGNVVTSWYYMLNTGDKTNPQFEPSSAELIYNMPTVTMMAEKLTETRLSIAVYDFDGDGLPDILKYPNIYFQRLAASNVGNATASIPGQPAGPTEGFSCTSPGNIKISRQACQCGLGQLLCAIGKYCGFATPAALHSQTNTHKICSDVKLLKNLSPCISPYSTDPAQSVAITEPCQCGSSQNTNNCDAGHYCLKTGFIENTEILGTTPWNEDMCVTATGLAYY